MSDFSKRTVSIYIDQTAAEASLTKLQAKADDLTKSIAAGQAAGKSMSAEIKKLGDTQTSIKSLQDQIEKGLAPTLQQQENLVRQLRNQLRLMSESNPDFEKLTAQFQEQNEQLTVMRARINGVTEAGEEMSNGFVRIFEHIAEGFASFFVIEKITELFKEFTTDAVEEANKTQESVDSLYLALENAGRTDVFGSLIRQADEFAEKYKALDRNDITGVFSKLVDYGKLTQKQMIDTTEVIINYAAKQKISLEEATDVVTKAFEGNSKALKTYGIDLSNAKTFTERYSTVVEVLGDKLKGAEAAFEETNQGAIAVLKEKFVDLQKATGNFLNTIQNVGVKTLSSFIDGFTSFIKALKDAPQFLNENSTGIKLIIAGIFLLNASYIKSGALIVRDTALKIINATTTKATAFASNIAAAAQLAYGEIVSLVSGEIGIATAAQNLWNIALMLGAGPIGVILIAVGALGVAVATLAGRTKELTAEQKIQLAVQDKIGDSSEDEVSKIRTLVTVINDNTTSLEGKKKALDELIQISPAYLSGLTLENIKTAEGTKIINGYIDSLQAKAEAEAKSALLSDKLKEKDKAFAQLRTDPNLKNKSDAQLADLSNVVETDEQFTLFGIAIGDPKKAGVNLKELKSTLEQVKILQKDVADIAKKNIEQEVADKSIVGDLDKRIAAAEAKLLTLKKGTKEYAEALAALNKLKGIEPPDPNADKKAEELAKKQEELLQKVKDFQFELSQIGKQADESEVAKIKKKYDDLIAAAEQYKGFMQKHKDEIIALQTEETRAIAYLKDQETKKNLEVSQKNFTERSGKEYEQALADSEAYFEELKKQQAESFVAKQIDQKQYNANIAAIDLASKQQQLQNAKDYSATVEKAAADVTKFKKDELSKEVADLIAANAKKLANEKLLKDLDEKAALIAAETAVKTAEKGSLEELDAKKKLLELQHQMDIAALEKQREDALLSLKGQYDAELKMLIEQLETKRKIELAAVDDTDPDAANKKNAINNRYNTAEGLAKGASAAQQTAAAVKINSDINALIKAANDAFRKGENDLNETAVEATAKKVKVVLQGIQTAINIVSQFQQVQAANAQRQLDKELQDNNVKKAALQKQLNQKLISVQSYNQQVAKLDADYDKKKQAMEKQQFERNKKIQIAQAIMNGALAVTSTFAARPGLADIFTLSTARAIEIGIAVATTAAEVAEIASAKYAAGGLVQPLPNGKITAAPNIEPLSNGDNVLATVRTGEVILNEQQQAALGGASTFARIGVPGFASGGLVPAYKTRTYRSIDYSGASRSMQTVKHYASGGLVTATNSTGQTVEAKTDPLLLETLQQTQAVNRQLVQTNQQLLQQLNKGIEANITLNKLQKAQDQQDRILAEAVFK